MSRLDFVEEELEALEQAGRLRSTRIIDGPQGATIRLDRRDAVNFSSNDYLGLANHPQVASAAIATLEAAGVGAGASRLVSGTLRPHDRLERALADFHEHEAALVFGSGFLANVGVLSALAGREDVILSDRLNHASLIDGARLSRAQILVYPHRDVDALARLLGEEGPRFRRRIIVSETLFSMDGDLAPVAALAELSQRHDAILVLDEAHALGVMGPGGRGAATEQGVRPDVLVATLGKALGAYGAYAATSAALRRFLLNRARTFIFTTGLPPAVAAAAEASLRIVRSKEGTRRRAALRDRVAQLASALRERGWLAPGAGLTPILPILVGDDRETMSLSDALLARGVYAQGIRPPTVPPGTSRLRISVLATHEADHVEQLVQALDETLGRRRVT